MSLSVDRVAKPGRLLGRRGTIGRPVPELQDTTFRALCRTFGPASVGFWAAAGQATAAQSSGSKLPRHRDLARLVQVGASAMAAAMRLGLVVFIMMAHPVHDFVFIAALGRQVEVVVGADQDVEAAGVGGVGVEDVAGFVAIEDAQAGEFAFGGVGFFVVVGGFSSGGVFGFEADAEVVVEVAAFR